MTGDIRAGAEAFLDLMRCMGRQADMDFDRHWNEEGDPRDYVVLTRLVEEGIRSHVLAASEEHRQGFLRALADMICANVDGAGVSCDGSWDPLRSSEAAFKAPAVAAEALLRIGRR